jgi:hypothetical protein
MADVSAQTIPDFGNLLTSFSRNEANIANTKANTEYMSGPQTQNTQANTGLIQQQTQKAAFEVQMIKQAMESMKRLPTGEDERSGEGSVTDPTETGVASLLNHKFQPPNPLGPPGIQQYINATAWVNPAESQRASDMRDKLVSGQTLKNQNEANDIFQTSTALSKSNAGLEGLLKTTHPGSTLNNIGKAIASDPDMSPEEKDSAARQAIASAAKYSHQYTGRELSVAGDQHVDKNTGFPVNAPAIGPTAGEKIGLGEWLNNPQEVTIDNRKATIRPKDLGITGYQDLAKNKSVKFSTPPPGSPQQTQSGTKPAQPSTPGGPMGPEQARNATSSQGGAPIPGLNPQQSDFVKQQPPGFPQIKNNQQLNADDMKQRDIYREQAKKLSDSTNVEYTRAQDSVTQIKRINTLLDTPGITLGPGSHEYSQFRTVLENWTGTSAGQAGAYQILSKVLNASEMNELLQQFHSEGAQVRLGAYESRLIMEKLAANPNLTKSAIQQMLKWQGSDAQYAMDKAKVAGTLLQTGKSVADFDKKYGEQFKKQDIVDSTLQILHPKGGPNFDKANGKTYTTAQVSEAAAHAGIPLSIFQDKLTKAGGIIK